MRLIVKMVLFDAGIGRCGCLTTHMVWEKTELKKPGTGFYVRGRHELLYICTKGSHVPDQRGKTPIGSVVEAGVREHSRKPEVFYDIIEAMYPDSNYLELFGRGQARPGWEVWGHEALVGEYLGRRQ